MKNPLIDQYIENAQEFAQPILKHIRNLVHEVCPQVEEKMKWSFPHFDYKGSMMCSMASFKQHVAFGFWKSSLIIDEHGWLQTENREAMGNLGKITSIKELPEEGVFKEYIAQACLLNEEGISLPKPAKKKLSQKVTVPDYILKEISKNIQAIKTFEAFSPSHKREYINWIDEAKTEPTRLKRLATAVEWMSEGKVRDWKYKK